MLYMLGRLEDFVIRDSQAVIKVLDSYLVESEVVESTKG